MSSISKQSRAWLRGMLTLLWLGGQMAQAAPPAWWSAGTPPVVNANAPNNAGPATVAQAKWMAYRALATIETIDPGLAGLIRGDLTGEGKAVLNWDAPVTPADIEKQKAPLTLGQLKALGAPFYARINDVAPDWLREERLVNETDTGDGIYPWTANTADDVNRSLATIGQLKAVFALHFTDPEVGDVRSTFAQSVIVLPDHIPALTDANSDGLLDDWAKANGVTSGAAADDDADGYPNLEEQIAGTNPKDAGSYPAALHGISFTVHGDSDVLAGSIVKDTYVLPWTGAASISATSYGSHLTPADLNALRDSQALPSTVSAAKTEDTSAGDWHVGRYYLGGAALPPGFAYFNATTYDDVGAPEGRYGTVGMTRAWLHLPAWTAAQQGSLLKVTQHSGSSGGTVYSGEVLTATVPAGAAESAPIDLKPESSYVANGGDYYLQNLVYLPSCPEIYLLSGHANDRIVLSQGLDIPCEWGLKNATPVIGTFDHPTNLGCAFSATGTGKNTIQLKIGGTVVWEKPVEVLQIISRAAWGASPPNTVPPLEPMPAINGITIHHTNTKAEGAVGVKSTQTDHLTRKEPYSDIAYHFLIDRTGKYYEGRQLEGLFPGAFVQGSHVYHNNRAAGLGVCMMADYEGSAEGSNGVPEIFSADRQLALEKLVAALSRRYGVTTDRISYHKAAAVRDTDCPGPAVIASFPAVIQEIRNLLR